MATWSDCRVVRPASYAEAARILAAERGARLVAGGTDLIPNLRRGLERPTLLVELGLVAEAAAVTLDDRTLVIGAGVTLARLAADERLAARFPALVTAARETAGPGHRTAATVGGNLCQDTRCVYYNQSEWWREANAYCLKRGGETCHVAPQGARCHAAFSGDLAPALVALGAEAELIGPQGTRRLALEACYRDDGAAHLVLDPGEVLARVHVPVPAAGWTNGYRKLRVRGSIDFPLAGVACALAMRAGALAGLRVALTGTNSQPLLLAETDSLVGKPVDAAAIAALGKLVQRQVSPMRTTVTQSNYRRQVAAVLAGRLVRELASVRPD